VSEPRTVTYRGRSLEEVLPKIREDLGPDAVIERQRSGLVGGVGGFFQREMVEVDARPADGSEVELPDAPGGHVDVFAGTDEDELRALTAPGVMEEEGLQSPAVRQVFEQASPFAELLADADDEDEEEEPPPAEPLRPEEWRGETELPAAGRHRPASAAAHAHALAAAGLSPELAAAIVAEAVTHVLPFAPARGLKRTVRATLARRIPVLSGVAGSRAIALAGPAGAGKTRVAAGLAAAYAAGSDLPVAVLSLRPKDVGAELAGLLEPSGLTVRPVEDGRGLRVHVAGRTSPALVVVDTPALSPRDAAGVRRLAEDLETAGGAEVHVVLPATISAPVARQVLRAYAPLAPAALAITHADETDHLGPLVDLAIAGGVPLSFVAAGADVPGEMSPADPAALAARLLP